MSNQETQTRQHIRTIWYHLIFLVGIMLSVSGCNQQSTSIPSSQSKYIGIWENQSYQEFNPETDNSYILFKIKPDRSWSYVKLQENSCSRLSGSNLDIVNHQNMKGSYLLFLTKEFKINQPPRQETNQWKMTIDGNTLYKSGKIKNDDYTFNCEAAHTFQ